MMDALDALVSKPETVITFVLPLGFVLLLVALLSGGSGRRMGRRINQIRARHVTGEVTPAQTISARRKARKGEIRALDDFIKRIMPQQDALRIRLARAGLEMSLGVYSLLCVLTGAAGFALSAASGFFPGPAEALIGVVCGLGLPHYLVGQLFARRQRMFIHHFPEAIDLMVRGVRAGLPITESIKAAGEEVPGPVGIELNRITDGIRLGRKMDEVLWEASNRLDLQEFKFFAIALSIQAETGGNLAETLNNLSEVLRGRRQLKRKIKALSSEAKASAYIIGSLPFIMTGLIYLVNAPYIVGLYQDVRGQIMIGVGLFMIFLGAMVMRQMVKFEI